MKLEKEHSVVLVSVNTNRRKNKKNNEQLLELEHLAKNLNMVTKHKFVQNLEVCDAKTFIGKGKLEEIKTFVISNNIEYVIFDEELYPKHIKNLEKELNCTVLYRTLLILRIFTLRAETLQAKAQVELAYYQHLLPRLSKMWTHLSRQRGGGANMRGAGEKELETDRRIAKNKISLLKAKLKKFEIQNVIQRKNQKKFIRIALVGYTNAGKSSLMNALTHSAVLVEDKLFATLDSSVKKTYIGEIPVLIADTVGFIRNLPHHLVQCFKSTLAQVIEADLLLHVIDISNADYNEHIEVVNNTLAEIGAGQIPVVYIYNKFDLIAGKDIGESNCFYIANSDYIFVSTKIKESIVALKNHIFPILEKIQRECYGICDPIIYNS